MRKLLTSIDKKTLQARTDLTPFIQDLKAKEAALDQLKKQKDAAKAAVQLAEKALKKQLKNKPSKPTTAKKSAKTPVAPKAAKPLIEKAITKKH